MSMAICFKCGWNKLEALLACPVCETTPQEDNERLLSLVLTEQFSTRSQLAHYSHELRNRLKLSIPLETYTKAQNALENPQQIEVKGNQSKSSNSQSHLPTTPSLQSKNTNDNQQESAISTSQRHDVHTKQKTSALHKTPFAILNVTTRDNRKRIMEMAEEKSLEIDSEVCQKSRSDLTNPRTRLSAEISWLPGVSPQKATQLLNTLVNDPKAVRNVSGLPTLAHLNLLAASLEVSDEKHYNLDLTSFIKEIAFIFDKLDAENVLRDINEDRAISGFPEIRALDQLEGELAERKRYYRSAIKDALDNLPSRSLVKVMTSTVDSVTSGGEDHAPELIDDLVDSYEVEAQSFLNLEAENIRKLIKAIQDSAKAGEAAIKPYVDNLIIVTRNWDEVAQPIQLSNKARGMNHDLSRILAYEIRTLAIDLFNNFDMLELSQQLLKILQELFSEIPEVSDRLEQDANTIADIFHKRKKDVANAAEWSKEITFRAEIGWIFKDILSISPDGVSWKGQSFPLESIKRVRWGGVRYSSGVTYAIAFGDGRSEALVELKNEGIYRKFIEKLWRAVCIRLLGEMLEILKDGLSIHFGDAVIQDDGIILVKRKLLGADEKVHCAWSQIQTWSADGSFHIQSKVHKKTDTAISFINVANTHILEQALLMAFKKPGLKRLSDLLH